MVVSFAQNMSSSVSSKRPVPINHLGSMLQCRCQLVAGKIYDLNAFVISVAMSEKPRV